MKYLLALLFLWLPFLCLGQKQKHIVRSPAYHTTHRPPLKDEPTGMPKHRKEDFTENSVYLCSSYKSRTYHNDRDCVELKFCRAGVIMLKQQEATEKEKRRPCAKCYSK